MKTINIENLIEKEVYHYYDGPLIYTMKDIKDDKIYLFLYTDSLKSSFYHYDIFLACCISPELLQKLIHNHLDLYDFYHLDNDFFLYYKYYNSIENRRSHSIKSISLEELKTLEYLPVPDFSF